MGRFARAIMSATAVTLLLAPAAWGQPQTSAQQKCINKMNKDGIKVEAQQGKENVECVKRKNNDELGPSQTGTQAEACTTADAKSKVFKKKGKTTADDGKFCQATGAPDFGYTGSANVNAAAQQAELDLIHDVFGPAPVDDGLYSKNPNVFEAVCQRNVIDRVEKLIQTMGREFVKCKKNALKTSKLPYLTGAASASDLNACVDDAGTPNSVEADTKGKIAKRLQNLLDTITKQCETGMTGVGSLVPRRVQRADEHQLAGLPERARPLPLLSDGQRHGRAERRLRRVRRREHQRQLPVIPSRQSLARKNEGGRAIFLPRLLRADHPRRSTVSVAPGLRRIIRAGKHADSRNGLRLRLRLGLRRVRASRGLWDRAQPQPQPQPEPQPLPTNPDTARASVGSGALSTFLLGRSAIWLDSRVAARYGDGA